MILPMKNSTVVCANRPNVEILLFGSTGGSIYLADTVSKSASYCRTSKQHPTGVMLLAETAMGKEKHLKKDKYKI